MVPEQQGIQVVDSETDMMTVMNTIAYSGSQDDGFYVCDLSDIIWKYKNWKNIMPRIKTYYAVKCNDSRIVLETLAALGSGFDCASKEEIRKVLSLGVNPDRIIFAHPTKKNSHIQYAAENGVTMMTFDCENELYKIKKCYPTAEIVIRIKFDDVTAKYVLGKKFGVYPGAEVNHLLTVARSLDMNVIGVCFHVGSDFKEFTILTNAIRVARKVFDMGFQLGYNFKLLDIGGGFSGTSGTSIEKLGCLINDTLEEHFPDHTVKIISEPGRYYVTSAFNLVSNIHTKKVMSKTISENTTEYIRMYYVDVSVYNSLIPCLFEDFFKIFPLRNVDHKVNQKKYPSIVWGPTCDPYDKISNGIEQLPEMEVGDWLVIEDAGAYTLSIACEFNGFCLPKIHGFIKKEDWILLTEEVTHPLPKDRFVHGKGKDIFLTGLNVPDNFKTNYF